MNFFSVAYFFKILLNFFHLYGMSPYKMDPKNVETFVQKVSSQSRMRNSSNFSSFTFLISECNIM